MLLIHIYQLIKQRIEAQVPDIQDFGWYMQQSTANYKGGLVTSPGCYLEYGTIDTKTQGQKMQQCTVPFTLHLITDCLQDSAERMSQSVHFTHLSLVSGLYEALSGYAPMLSDLPEYAALKDTAADYQVFTSPERLNIVTDHSNRSVIRTTQLFSTTAKDYSATPKYTKISRPLEIEKIRLIPSPPFQP